MPAGRKRASDLTTDGCEPPCGFWELNLGPLEEQAVLFKPDFSCTGNCIPSLTPWGPGVRAFTLSNLCSNSKVHIKLDPTVILIDRTH